MKLYRCENCGKTFSADKPKCETCRIDPAAHPRFASLFTELVTIHFDPPTHVKGIGWNVLACDRRQRVGASGNRATGEPSAVSCAACRATKEWAAANRGDPVMVEGEDEVRSSDDHLDEHGGGEGTAGVVSIDPPKGGGAAGILVAAGK